MHLKKNNMIFDASFILGGMIKGKRLLVKQQGKEEK
jgi:predicted proteasome-type protease